MGIYFLMYKVSLELWVGHGWFTGRENSDTGLVENIWYFVSHTLFLLAGFWEVFRAAAGDSGGYYFSFMFPITLLGWISLNWLIPISRNWRHLYNWGQPLLLILAFGLILAPVIISGERYLNFRLYAVGYVALIVFTISGGGIRKMDTKPEQNPGNSFAKRYIGVCRLPNVESCSA
jgi:uncharacterized membrane protein